MSETQEVDLEIQWEGMMVASDDSEVGVYPPQPVLSLSDGILQRVPRVFYHARENQPPVTRGSALLGLVILLDLGHDSAMTRWLMNFAL